MSLEALQVAFGVTLGLVLSVLLLPVLLLWLGLEAFAEHFENLRR